MTATMKTLMITLQNVMNIMMTLKITTMAMSRMVMITMSSLMMMTSLMMTMTMTMRLKKVGSSGENRRWRQEESILTGSATGSTIPACIL